MGCPNFFKYHPDATLGEYCSKFGYDEKLLKETISKESPGIGKINDDAAYLSSVKEMDLKGETDRLYEKAVDESSKDKTENALRAESGYNGLSYPDASSKEDAYKAHELPEKYSDIDDSRIRTDEHIIPKDADYKHIRRISERLERPEYEPGIYRSASYEFSVKTDYMTLSDYIGHIDMEDGILPADASTSETAESPENTENEDEWETISIPIDVSDKDYVETLLSCRHVTIRFADDKKNSTQRKGIERCKMTRAVMIGISDGLAYVRIKNGIGDLKVESLEPAMQKEA